jgi:hypothetical protein
MNNPSLETQFQDLVAPSLEEWAIVKIDGRSHLAGHVFGHPDFCWGARVVTAPLRRSQEMIAGPKQNRASIDWASAATVFWPMNGVLQSFGSLFPNGG